MRAVCIVYRKASRELALPDSARILLGRLLRELATNSIQRRLAWHIKADFLTLWFISAGRFPGLPESITDWAVNQLPFKLNENERQILSL